MPILNRERICLAIGFIAAGALLFPPTFSQAAARAMTFKLVPLSDPARCGVRCVEVVSAVGEITNSTPKDYLKFLSEHAKDRRFRPLVFITSPGGRVVASMKFGELLRATDAMVIIARIRASRPGSGHNAYMAPSACYSACVYAFMGGKKRVIPPHSVAGIHKMFDYVYGPDPNGGDHRRHKIYDTGALSSALEKYAHVMGVSPSLVAKAETVSSSSIHIITPVEMRRWRLAVRKF